MNSTRSNVSTASPSHANNGTSARHVVIIQSPKAVRCGAVR